MKLPWATRWKGAGRCDVVNRQLTRPSVVIFDLGKVLVDFDYAIAVRRIAARGRLTAEELGRFIGTAPLLFRYELGLLNSLEFYKELCEVTGFCGPFDEFSLAFGDIFSPIEPMVELQAALRSERIPTFVLSNTNDLAIQHIRRSYPFFSQFQGYILSYEHGVMKPEPRIYEIAEALCGQRGRDILFVDDRPENISAAAERGWQVILQETPEKTITAIQQSGLLQTLKYKR